MKGHTMTGFVSINGFDDPQGEAPWAMQLVCNVPKTDPPTHTAVCEAAAVAVVSILADPRSSTGGDWEPALDRWLRGRIRKHTRKARGAHWDRALAIDGITVTRNGASVRAFVPTATDNIPRDIGRLRMEGFNIADSDTVDETPATVLTIALSADPVLETGKAAAACGHAAQVAWMRLDSDARARWADNGFPLQIEQPDVARWTALLDTAPVRIVDAGFTAVAAGTTTAVAYGTLLNNT
jgi:peptidyl-tRNA hydrolase